MNYELSKKLRDLEEKIELMKTESSTVYAQGYNKALKDVKALIKNEYSN